MPRTTREMPSRSLRYHMSLMVVAAHVLARPAASFALRPAMSGALRTLMMAQPNARCRRKVSVHCAKCDARLYRYAKGGKGALVKCFVERIVEDYTVVPCECPSCGVLFARPTMMRGKPAHKIIGGKAYMKKK